MNHTTFQSVDGGVAARAIVRVILPDVQTITRVDGCSATHSAQHHSASPNTVTSTGVKGVRVNEPNIGYRNTTITTTTTPLKDACGVYTFRLPNGSVSSTSSTAVCRKIRLSADGQQVIIEETPDIGDGCLLSVSASRGACAFGSSQTVIPVRAYEILAERGMHPPLANLSK